MQLQIIQQLIYEIRGQKVMLDFDLAKLYAFFNPGYKPGDLERHKSSQKVYVRIL